MNEERAPDRSSWPWIAVAIAAGLALRLTGLSQQSLWLDEMTSIHVAGQSIAHIFSGHAFDNHTPPLYYILLHLWAQLVPLNEFGLRLFSVGIDLLNMLALAYLCRQCFAPKTALLVVAAYALSPFMLYYAQEGRMYTLAVLMALLVTIALYKLIKSERHMIRWAALSGLVMALGVYTHYYLGFFILGVVAVALTAARAAPKRLAAIVAACAFALLLFSPWIPIALQLAESGGQTFRAFSSTLLPYTFFRFMAGYAILPLTHEVKAQFLHSLVENAPFIVITFGSLLLLALGMFRRIKARDGQTLALTAILLIPLAVSLLISLKVPMLSERYLIVCFPAFLMLILGFQDLKRRSVQAALILFLAVNLAGDIRYFTNPHFGKAQWREAAHYVQDNNGDNAAILFHAGYVENVFKYYYRGAGHMYRSDADDGDTRAFADQPRLWLVIAHARDGEAYPRSFLTRYHVVKEKYFPLEVGIRVMLLERGVVSSEGGDL